MDWPLPDWSGWLDEGAAAEHRRILEELEDVDRRESERLLDELDVEYFSIRRT